MSQLKNFLQSLQSLVGTNINVISRSLCMCSGTSPLHTCLYPLLRRIMFMHELDRTHSRICVDITADLKSYSVVVFSTRGIEVLMHASKGILNLPTLSSPASVHLFNKIVRSGFTINSPPLENNWVKIHHRENKVG